MSNPLLLPEIVDLVAENVQAISDLLSCACVNSTWNRAAVKKLYEGSLGDMQFCTPDIGSLNCLFVASRKRFTRNMRFLRHLLLTPDTPTIDDVAQPDYKLACFEKIRALRDPTAAKLLFQPQGKGLKSLTVPFEIVSQDLTLKPRLPLPPTVEYLSIDGSYLDRLIIIPEYTQELTTSAVSPDTSSGFLIPDIGRMVSQI